MDKYLFVLTYFIGGGTEKVFTDIASHLLLKNKEVYLFVINSFDKLKFNINSKIKILTSLKQAKKIINKDFEVINFSGDWKSGIYARFFSKKIISWVHCNPYTMKSARTSFINFWILRHSKKIVCVCNEQKSILQNEYKFKNQIYTIYNCINFEIIAKLSNERKPYTEKNYILMVARFDTKSKDFITLITAYSYLSDELKSKYNLILLGNGPDLDETKEFVRNNHLSQNIVFPGYDSNPYKWMKNASCFILSSITEGISLVPLEAFACNTPVVLTKYHTGSTEVSENGKSALLVDIGDSCSMANAITSVLYDEKIKSELLKNSKNHLQKFSSEIFNQKIDELFEL